MIIFIKLIHQNDVIRLVKPFIILAAGVQIWGLGVQIDIEDGLDTTTADLDTGEKKCQLCYFLKLENL